MVRTLAAALSMWKLLTALIPSTTKVKTYLQWQKKGKKSFKSNIKWHRPHSYGFAGRSLSGWIKRERCQWEVMPDWFEVNWEEFYNLWCRIQPMVSNVEPRSDSEDCGWILIDGVNYIVKCQKHSSFDGIIFELDRTGLKLEQEKCDVCHWLA